jgi:6-pyruvoyltetrahydropterin/6-carboxytetrahydropterin synthase
MFEVSVTGKFHATHQLCMPDGAREPPHTHPWRVTVTLVGPRLDETGVLVDFAELEPRLRSVLADLAERNLNEHPAFAERSPSAENVAVHVAEMLDDGIWAACGVRIQSVEVEEAPGCIARYLPQ